MKKRKHGIVQADSPEGQLAGEGIIEAIENQSRDNDPPETRITLDRLMSLASFAKVSWLFSLHEKTGLHPLYISRSRR